MSERTAVKRGTVTLDADVAWLLACILQGRVASKRKIPKLARGQMSDEQARQVLGEFIAACDRIAGAQLSEKLIDLLNRRAEEISPAV